MRIERTAIPEIIMIEPDVFRDERGFFFESYNARHFAEMTGIVMNFVQDNHSKSARNVLRGLHYQIKQPQGKLIRVVAGEIYDVAVDIRQGSKTFGEWVGFTLSAENKRQLWIPEGFAHGFTVTSDSAEVLYKTTDYYAPEHEHCIAWNDPIINIDWPLKTAPILSQKDQNGKWLKEAHVFAYGSEP